MRRVIALLAAIAWLATFSTAFADPPAEVAPGLEYVRVYAPESEIDAWPLGDDKYLPVDAAEFERLTQLIERGAQGRATSSRCRIERITGRATLDGEHMRGRISMSIAHDGGGPTLLPLAPWGLAITAAQWSTPQAGPASLGLTTGNRLALIVERSGELHVDFVLRGTARDTGEMDFRLAIPPAAATEWEIEGPASQRISVKGGMPTAEASGTPDTQRWRVELPPGETLQLTSARSDIAESQRVELTLQKTTYLLATNGVEVIAELQLRADAGLPREIQVQLDPELNFVSAQSKAQSLVWERQSPANDQRVTLQLPADDATNSTTVRLAAWCPLRAGVNWSLPRLRLADADWRDGQVDVMIPEPLGLTEVVSANGMRQSRVGQLAAPLTGDSLTFDCFSPEARLELRVDPREPTLRVVSGTAVEVGPRETTARLTCDLEAQGGEVFKLVGRIAPGWLIDDVISTPEDVVREFERDPQNNTLFTVHLQQALKPRESLRLVVNARRTNPRSGDSTPVALLAPVQWTQAARNREFFSLRSSGELQWRLDAADAAAAITRDYLTARERELLNVVSEETLLELVDDNAGARAFIEPRPHAFRAEALAEFLVEPDALVERYTLQCVPEQGAVDTFLVRVSPRRDAPLTWKCEAAIPVAATAERVENGAPPTDEIGPTVETWQVRLWPPQTGPFRMLAERRGRWDERASLGLVELPDAVSKYGTARIRADEGLPLTVTAHGPTPVMFRDDASTPPIRAEYRFDPARDVNRGGESALEISVQQRSPATHGVILRSETIDMQLTPDGEWHVRADYALDVSVASTWSVQLPPDAVLLRVRRGAETPTFHRNGRALNVDLAARDPRGEATIEYCVKRTADLAADELMPPLPEWRDAMHPRTWQLRLPSDYELVRVAAPWQCEQVAAGDWQTRLFGPLARTGDKTPFLPWRTEFSRAEPDREDSAWAITGPARGAPALRIRPREGSVRGWACAALLAGAICWRLGTWRRGSFAIAPLCCAAGGLGVGIGLSPYAAGAFVGACAAAILGVVFLPNVASAKAQASPLEQVGSTTRTLVIRAVHALWIALVMLSAVSYADDAETPPSRVYRVFIPIDAEQHPTGARYYVPEELWNALRERAAELGDESPSWCITAAEYAIGAKQSPAAELDQVRANYVLRTFRDNVQVELPAGDWLTSTVQSPRLDGSQIPKLGAGPLRFRVPEAGEHRLEMLLRAEDTELSERQVFQFAVLPHPGATLQAWIAPDAYGQVDLDSQETVERNRIDGRLSALLGPVNKISVSATVPASDASAPAPVELEQFVWLHIAPERVVAEVRHQIVAAGRPVGQLEMSMDPRWRTARGVSATNVVAPRIENLPQDRVKLLWEKPGSVGERFAVSLEQESDTGIGELSFPVITPVGAVVRRRWCALSLDPAVELTSLVNAASGVLTATQFNAAWGDPNGAPDRVFSWPNDGATPNLQTAFLRPTTKSQENWTLTAHADRLDVRLAAMIETTQSPVFSHRISVPPGLEVHEVSLLQDGAQRVTRWTRDEDGAVQAYFSGPTVGRQNLSLEGSLPLASAQMMLSPLGVTADVVESRTVQLYRHRTALVDQLSPVASNVQASSSNEASSNGNRRGVGQWELPATRENIAFRVRPNGPRSSALQVLSLHSGPAGWNAQLDYAFTANDGVVDEFRFEIDRAWTGPFTLEPAWPMTLNTALGAGAQVLVVRPPTAQTGDVQLRIRGALTFVDGAAPTAPLCRALGVGRLQQFVALPDRAGERRLDWILQGARATRAPNSWIAPDKAIAWTAFEVVAPSFSAAAESRDRTTGAPTLALADYALRIEADGSYRGRTRWMLNPGGMQLLPIRLPAGAKILSCDVLGRRIEPQATSPGSWLLPLVSDQLPQEIECWYGGSLDMRVQSAAPIPEVPQARLERTHWTLIRDHAAGITPRGAADSLAQGLERYQVIADAIEEGSRRAGLVGGAVTATPEGMLWFETTLQTLAAARARVMRTIDGNVDRAAARQAGIDLEKLDQRVGTAFAAKPNLAKLVSEAFAEDLDPPADVDAMDDASTGKDVALYRGEAAFAPPPIAFGYAQRQTGLLRVAAVLALLALAGAVYRGGARMRRLADVAVRPWMAPLALGVAWWLWLAPSAFGLCIVALALMMAMQARSAPDVAEHSSRHRWNAV